MKELRESLTIVTLRKELAEYKQRAEAAEAKLRKLDEQEPIAFIRQCEFGNPGLMWNPVVRFSYASQLQEYADIPLVMYVKQDTK